MCTKFTHGFYAQILVVSFNDNGTKVFKRGSFSLVLQNLG
jgi:hypothetical protein